VGDVGRPDLLEKAAGITGTMRKGASDLFHSLEKFNALPDHLLVWPGHGAGSACGKSLGGVPVSSLGYERLANWAFAFLANGGDEHQFAESVLADQPEPPLYFAEMKRVNKIGLPAPDAEAVPELAASQLESAREPGRVLLDVRAVERHVKAGLPDSIEIPLMRTFTTWAGSLVAYGETIYVIADSAAQVADAVKALRMIGMDRVAGWFNAVALSTSLMEPLSRISAEDASREVAQGTTTLDVRGGTEYRKGHIDGAIHIPLGYLPKEFGSLPKNTRLIAYCSSGIRSAIAASYLRRKGFTNVHALQVGMGALQSTQAKEHVGAA
jgi:hydroxyacylglutathione hydrolase